MQRLHPVILKVPPEFDRLKVPDRVRALSDLARRAVRQSAAHSNAVLEVLRKNGEGVPQPCNGIYWSLSHKNQYVAGVVAAAPIGIDVERIKPVRTGLYAKVASDSEWRLAGGSNTMAFYRYWTAKEAVLKVAGIGIRGLRRCRVEKIVDEETMILHYDGHRFRIAQYPFDRHLAAVTCPDDRRVVWSPP